MEYTHIIHPFPPLWDKESRVLILGSFPSVKSREQMFFYGHPQNRFWRVLSAVLGEEVPQTVNEKSALLHAHHIALWDVIASCDIRGSGDASVRNAVPTDLRPILAGAPVTAVFCNGALSGRMYRQYQQGVLGISAAVLPSTSPANAAWTLARLTDAWQAVAEALSDGENGAYRTDPDAGR